MTDSQVAAERRSSPPRDTSPAEASSAVRAASPAQTAIDLRAVVARLLRRLREAGADGSVTPAQASALARLGKGGLWTVSALARAEKVRPQSMASTVAALADAGLVSRRPDPDDGRRQIIGLTEAGWQRTAGQKEAGVAWLEEALAVRVDETELQALAEAITVLERILA